MYQGKFKCTNPSKYRGSLDNICYRSSWELSLMLWCDQNPKVVSWSSEELVIPYLCPTDGRHHRYFVDFVVTFNNGETHWIEIKPKKYTVEPGRPKRLTKRYLSEVMSYAKNKAKWAAAHDFARENHATFKVWTEDTLKSLGIKLLGK